MSASPTSPAAEDDSAFPAEVYKQTVLAPLFEAAKAHFRGFMQRIDRAHLVMLAETGVIERAQAAAIARALDAIDRELDPEQIVYTGEVEDFFFLIEAELTRRLGADLAGRLHTGRSRNDIDHTLFKLGLKGRLDLLAGKLRGLGQALLATATRERATLIVAYTHGQPAQPTTFGHYLAAALEIVLRDLERLTAARTTLDLCPMGAAAITTTGFAIDRARTAELLGFMAPLRNSYGCIAAIDYVTATYSAVELVFLHLGRLVQDLQFWASFEVGQLYVPNAFVQISSIMPQKRNPVPIEHLRLLCSHTVSGARAMLDVMHNTPFTDMNDGEGETQVRGYAAFESGGRVLDLLAGLIAALRVEPANVRRNIERSCITVTELADTLVRREGLSFRMAHEIAAAVARSVMGTGAGLAAGYPAFRAAFETLAGRAPVLDPIGFAEATSPERFVAVRERFGGPGPSAMAEALAHYRAELERLSAEAAAVARRETAAAARLDAAFARLLAA